MSLIICFIGVNLNTCLVLKNPYSKTNLQNHNHSCREWLILHEGILKLPTMKTTNAISLFLSALIFREFDATDPYTMTAAGCFLGHLGIGHLMCVFACASRRCTDARPCIDWAGFPHCQMERDRICWNLVFPTCSPCVLFGDRMGAECCRSCHESCVDDNQPGYNVDSQRERREVNPGPRHVHQSTRSEPIYSPRQ